MIRNMKRQNNLVTDYAIGVDMTNGREAFYQIEQMAIGRD